MSMRSFQGMAAQVRRTWRGDAVYRGVRAASSAGALSASRAVLRRARPRVPLDTGAMRDSAKETLLAEGVAAVGYLRPGPNGEVITIRQHEDLTLNHPKQGEARWLARTINDYADESLADFAAPVRDYIKTGRTR